MAPRGEIALTLTTEEANALKQELQQLCAQHHTTREDLLQAILQKIRRAEEKML